MLYPLGQTMEGDSESTAHYFCFCHSRLAVGTPNVRIYKVLSLHIKALLIGMKDNLNPIPYSVDGDSPTSQVLVVNMLVVNPLVGLLDGCESNERR